MTTTTDIIDAFGVLGFSSIALVTTIPGWLTNQPDSSRRFMWRLISSAALLGFWICIWALNHDRHWYQWILFFLGFVWLIDRISKWWNKMEQYRKIERFLKKQGWREYGKNGWTP